MEIPTSIIIPWRDSGCPWRRRSFQYVMRHMDPYSPIVVDNGANPFSRSGSKNLGAELCESDVVLFLDADTVIPHAQIDAAIEKARGGSVVYPYTEYHSMNMRSTKNIYSGFRPTGDISQWHIDWATGGGVAMPKEVFLEIGRYDEEFIDWGMEDAAILVMARKHGIDIERIEGNCYHLWHPREPENDQIRANADRYRKIYLGEE